MVCWPSTLMVVALAALCALGVPVGLYGAKMAPASVPGLRDACFLLALGSSALCTVALASFFGSKRPNLAQLAASVCLVLPMAVGGAGPLSMVLAWLLLTTLFALGQRSFGRGHVVETTLPLAILAMLLAIMSPVVEKALAKSPRHDVPIDHAESAARTDSAR